MHKTNLLHFVMDNIIYKKLEYLKWLSFIGIEYYFSQEKDSNISWIKKLATKTQNLTDSSPMLSSNTVINQENGGGGNEDNNLTISDSRKLADKVDSLEKLQEIVMNFDGCELKNFAENTVFSDGNPKAEIMLIGEAPGANEDRMGIPFCGESGQLLDTMFSTISLSRKKNIYITNTVFWRPPANRRPTKQEIEICRPFLEKHIALINPKLLICVGSTAVAGLLDDSIAMHKARNSHYFYQNKYLVNPINTVAIFHPAYLLRQPGKKKDSWFDLIKIRKFIEEKNIC